MFYKGWFGVFPGLSTLLIYTSMGGWEVSRSVVSDSATPWTVVYQAPLSMHFWGQEYWSGLPFPPPRDLPNPGIEPMSPVTPALADSLPLSHVESTVSSIRMTRGIRKGKGVFFVFFQILEYNTIFHKLWSMDHLQNLRWLWKIEILDVISDLMNPFLCK